MDEYTPVKREWHGDRWYVTVSEEEWELLKRNIYTMKEHIQLLEQEIQDEIISRT